MGSVSAEEIDNWPENDAWLHIELISWTANQTVEWDNNDGLPDPQFRICIEADGDNVDCINSPTWENQWSLNNSWNYSLDIPDHSNILNITIECEDNDAFNDDECDMNSELNEWKLYAEYNWSATPTLTVTGNGDGDGNDTWNNAASTWKFSIDGFGDEDGDGVSDNIDKCSDTQSGSVLLNQSIYPGCSWLDLDNDLDGILNSEDSDHYNYFKGKDTENSLSDIQNLIDAEWMSIGTQINEQGSNSLTNLNLLMYENNSYAMLATGIVHVQTGDYTKYEEIICGNLPTDGECTPWSGQYSQRDKHSFDYDGDGNLDIITDGEIYSYHLGKFWRTDVDHDSCSNFAGIYLWYDLDFDGTVERYCTVSAGGGNQKLLDSTCKEIQDLKFEPTSEHWILVCVKNSINQNTYDVYIDSYSKNGTLISSEIIQNSLQENGILTHTLLDIDQNGNLDLLYGDNPAHFCLNIKSTLNYNIGCQSLEWESPWGYVSNFEEIFYTDFNGDGYTDIGLEQGIIQISESEIIHKKLFDFDFYVGKNLFGSTYADIDEDGDYDFIAVADGYLKAKINPAISDNDKDGIQDSDDLCMNSPTDEIVNLTGCSESQIDEDQDGVFNSEDICQNTPTGQVVDFEGCSDYQKDSDSDGIVDALDECEDTQSGDVVNFRGCSTEESTDADGDGVVDSEDVCPSTRPGYPVLENGCPDEESLEVDLDGDGYSGPYSKILFVQSGDAFPLDPTQWFDEDNDGYGDNPSPANNYDACPNTKSGASVNAFGCSDEQLDSDYDGVSNAEDAFPYDQYEQYDADNDGIGDNSDQCSDSIVSNVDSTGCSQSQLDSASAGSDGDAMLGFMTCCVLPIGMVVYFSRPKKKKATKPIQYVPMNIPASRPVQRQPTQQEMHAQNMLLEKQRETNHLQQQLANQASQTQHLQQQLAQQNQTAAQMNSMQAELAALQQSKATLEKELEEAAKGTTVVQNITYNIQDSAIAGDLNANLNPKSDEN